MLLRFGAKNFFCFKEGIEISLELGTKCPEIVSRGNSVANLLCVKGANASGKSNALKILAFLRYFCCDSFQLKPEEKILIHSFFNNNDPIDLFCDFTIDNVKYRYELSLTANRVVYEKLERKIKRLITVFERKENKLESFINEFKSLTQIKIRTNASLISTAHQYEVTNLQPVYDFFDSIIANLSWMGRQRSSLNYKDVSEYYNNNPEVFKTAIKIIKACDLGISDIEILHTEDKEDSMEYFPIFYHDANIKNNILPFHHQSLGTQTLFNSIPFYLDAIMGGGILVMDEFDIDFHPHMLPKIVSYFDNDKLNTQNAQMIFSTHNTDILDYMSKYRTVLVNKENSECYGYRLDEIPGDIIRNDRPLAPVYNSGKIGGVPRI